MIPENQIDRRRFLKTSAKAAVGAAAATTAFPRPARAGANEKFTIGIMGIKGRGHFLVENLLERSDVDIAYICDVDANFIPRTADLIKKASGKSPKVVNDYRQILDDKSVDALFNATPDHWHALPTIHACQAGKDVYVEKPASHNIWEGRQMVNAAQKYKRIVQAGTQTRSAPYTIAAKEYITSGKLGNVHLCRVVNMKSRSNIGIQPDGDPPNGVDYDRWLGPAPKRPFNPNRFHYHWHWFWEYSGGDIINDGIHQIDAARYLIGKDYPNGCSATGGKFFFDDAQECPDTQVATWDYDDMTMVFELTLFTPYMSKTPWELRNTDEYPYWPQNATRVEIYGTKGLMLFGRHGGGWQVFEADGKVVAEHPGRRPLAQHFDNFFDCIKTRNRPNAQIEECHRSTLLCQLGNISYRLGGRKLQFDPKTETIRNDTEAGHLAKRTGRKGYEIPEIKT
jgi:predicted dehydrogenase